MPDHDNDCAVASAVGVDFEPHSVNEPVNEHDSVVIGSIGVGCEPNREYDDAVVFRFCRDWLSTLSCS